MKEFFNGFLSRVALNPHIFKKYILILKMQLNRMLLYNVSINISGKNNNLGLVRMMKNLRNKSRSIAMSFFAIV